MAIFYPYASDISRPAPREAQVVDGRVLGERVLIATAMLLLYVLFGLLYDQVVAPIYAFGGFVANPAAQAWPQAALVFASGLLMPRTMAKMSDVFVWLSMIVLLVPAAVLVSHEGVESGTMLMMFGGVALVKALCVLFERLHLLESWVKSRRDDYRVAIGPLLVLLFAVLALLAVHVGGALSFNFQDVYDLRFDFNASLTFPLNYLLPFAAGPLAGCITAMALEKRQYPVLGVVMVCGFLFFGLSSHKALMFNPPFVFCAWLFLRQRRGGLLLTAFFAVLAIGTLLVHGSLADLLGASFANRLVFIPAQIHYYFFREFQDIGFQYWAESRFGLGLSQSRLPIDSVNYIGLVMAGDASIGANTGWIANGYMNAGFAGIAFYAVVLALTLHALDTLGRRYSASLVAAAFLVPVLNIINAIDLLAGFLTGGLLLLFVVFLMAVRPAGGTAA